MPRVRSMFRLQAGLVLTSGVLALAAVVASRGLTGLRLEIRGAPAFGGPRLRTGVAAIDGDALRDTQRLPTQAFSARWIGRWRVGETGTHRLQVRTNGRFLLRLDGQVVLQRPHGGGRRVRADMPLTRGWHALEAEYEAGDGEAALRLAWAPPGRDVRPLPRLDLAPPGAGGATRALAVAVRTLPWLTFGFVAVPPLALLAGAWRWQRRARGCWREWPPLRAWLDDAWHARLRSAGRRLRPALAPALAMVVVAYAAALRFEALVDRYWWDAAPAWAAAAAEEIRAWRPGPAWEAESDRYGGDPRRYIIFAREAGRFFDASVREPLYVFATKLGLLVAEGQDVGVSFASVAFSTLAVLATYLLGAAAFSPAVGVAAAFCLAIESYALGLSSEGWRDDAFASLVALSAWSLLRLRRRASFPRALIAGLLCGAACLTRVTALSFVVPAFAWLWLAAAGTASERRMLRERLIAGAIVAGALLLPFLASCALAYGDPLYAINYHTGFYRSRLEMPARDAMGWFEFLNRRYQPLELATTLAVGVTRYPFANKWAGFDGWARQLGPALALASLVGLVQWLWQPAGRLLLLILATSLLPYAFTWNILGGAEWRFTYHAYPFYLVAAWSALASGARLLRAAGWAAPRERRNAGMRLAATSAMVLAVAWWWSPSVVRRREFARTVEAGRPARLEVGPGDARFIGEGWHPAIAIGNTTVRFSRGPRATLWLPLLRGHAHRLELRLDPFSYAGAPAQRIRVKLNGAELSLLELRDAPERTATYAVAIPAEHVRGGDRLDLEADWSVNAQGVAEPSMPFARDWDVAFCLRSLRVVPLPEPAGPASLAPGPLRPGAATVAARRRLARPEAAAARARFHRAGPAAPSPP